MYSLRKEKTVPTSVRLKPEFEERLANLSALTGRSKAFYISEALESYLPQMEYEYGILKQVEEYRAGRLVTYSLDEVKSHCGLED